MIKATRYLVAILAVGACTSDSLDGTSATSSSVFRIDRTERAKDGVPYFVHGTLGAPSTPIFTLGDVDVAMAGVLPDIGRAIAVPSDQLVARRVDHDLIGMTHVRYAQRANGFEVVSGVVIVHIAADGTIASVSNGARDASGMPTAPLVAASTAVDVARTRTPGAIAASTPDLVYVVANGDGDLHFAWRTEVTGPMLRDTVFIDTTSGQIVARHPHIQTAKNRTVFTGGDTQGGTPTGATQAGTEGNPPTEMVDKAAYDNTGTTYDCYTEMFARDSYDDAGAELISYSHTTEFGQPLANAFWDGSEMVYGDGDAGNHIFAPLALALDVTAHELTHAVTERTAGLVYQDESGGLNEASSDILGNSCEAHRDGMVSANTWLVGEDIFTPGTPGDALRYMNNPTLDAPLYNDGSVSLDYFPDYQSGIDVHFSSGIANLFYYLVTMGGPHPRSKTPYNVIGIGIDKSEQIWYRALTMYFMPNETFAMARTDTEMAASDLFPGVTKTAVSMAWATVGVGQPPVDNIAPTITITAPGDTENVTEGFTITADASDDQGVLRVDFSIDGTVIGSSTTAPYTFTSPTTIDFGMHTVEATAFDAVNHTSDSVMVNIIDPTCGNSCTSDQHCDMMTGLCVDNGGCCSGGGPVGGSLLLITGVGFVLSRRRRQR